MGAAGRDRRHAGLERHLGQRERRLVPAVLVGLALAGAVMLADVGSLYLQATTRS